MEQFLPAPVLILSRVASVLSLAIPLVWPALLLDFILLDAAPCYWLHRHRERFVHHE